MQKKAVTAAVVGLILFTLVTELAGCGVTVYETVHSCGDWTISSMEKLFFDSRTTAKQLEKEIPEFCLYEQKDSQDEVVGYNADVAVKVDDFVLNLTIVFDEDKTLEYWITADAPFWNDGALDLTCDLYLALTEKLGEADYIDAPGGYFWRVGNGNGMLRVIDESGKLTYYQE